MVDGHKEPGGKFHPHNDKPGIHSGSVNSSTNVQAPGHEKYGKTLHASTHEKNYWESRFKQAKQQNSDYEQIMDGLQDEIKQAKAEGKDPSYYEHLYKEIVSAERVRPHKSFDYDWITQVVEEEIEQHPGISEQDLYLKAKERHKDVTDERIHRGIKHLENDGMISMKDGHFKSTSDYIHDKDGRY